MKKDAESTDDSDSDSDALSDLAVDISSATPAMIFEKIRILEEAEADRAAARHATKVLACLTANKIDEVASLITEGRGIPALVKHLQAPLSTKADGKPFEHDVERGSALALANLAKKVECKDQMLGCGALPLLLDILKRRPRYNVAASHMSSLNKLFRCSCLAIMNLAVDDEYVKDLIRDLGGIPPLVDLLELADPLVQMVGTHTLLTLAKNNSNNKLAIVELHALPSLIYMLESDESDYSLQFLSVSLIHSLITNSSETMKKDIVADGVLQPIISLLRSSRAITLKATHIVSALSDDPLCFQRGVLSPLISLLDSKDNQLRQVSAYALGCLAQDTHNQVGIGYSGGLPPLIKQLMSSHERVQNAAAMALSYIAANKDNVVQFISLGGVQVLQHRDFILKETREFVKKTWQRLEDIIQTGKVLTQLVQLMRRAESPEVSVSVSMALAHLCSAKDLKSIFIDNYGLEILLGLLSSPSGQRDAALTLSKLAKKAGSKATKTSHSSNLTQIYMWHSAPSDLTIHVEDASFYVHRDCLVASSDAFQAMLDGDYREKDLGYIEIPDIRADIFEMMLRFIYTGIADVSVDLLRAADRYLLHGLKRLCQDVLSQELSVTNVIDMYLISDECYASSLRNSCILFLLDHFDEIESSIWREIPISNIRFCFAEVIMHSRYWEKRASDIM